MHACINVAPKHKKIEDKTKKKLLKIPKKDYIDLVCGLFSTSEIQLFLYRLSIIYRTGSPDNVDMFRWNGKCIRQYWPIKLHKTSLIFDCYPLMTHIFCYNFTFRWPIATLTAFYNKIPQMIHIFYFTAHPHCVRKRIFVIIVYI